MCACVCACGVCVRVVCVCVRVRVCEREKIDTQEILTVFVLVSALMALTMRTKDVRVRL